MTIKEAERYCVYVVDDKHAIYIDEHGVKIDNDFDIKEHEGWNFKELELPEGQMVCVFLHDSSCDPWSSEYTEEYYLCMINGRLGLYHTCDTWTYAPHLHAQFIDGKWVEED